VFSLLRIENISPSVIHRHSELTLALLGLITAAYGSIISELSESI